MSRERAPEKTPAQPPRVREALRRVQESGLDPIELAGSVWGLTVASWRRMPRFIRTPVIVVTQTFKVYSADRCNIFAAAIAYYAIFSVIPLLIITLSILGLVVSEARVVEFIYDQFAIEESTEATDTISEVVRATKNLSTAGLAIGSVAFAWTASGVFSAIRQGLNAVSHEKRGQSFFRGKIIDIALVPLMGVVIFVGLIANSVMQAALDELAQVEWIRVYRDTFWRATSMAVAAVLTYLFFLFIYRFVPTVRPSWKQAMIGALLATILFEGLRYLASWLIGFAAFSGSGALYASLATALAFLYVMRIVGSILLVGAVFGRVVVGLERDEPQEQPV